MRRVLVIPGGDGSGRFEELIRGDPGAFCRIDIDLLRRMFHGANRSESDEAFSKRQSDDLILAALNDGRNVLVEDSKFDRQAEHNLRRLVRGLAAVEISASSPAAGAPPTAGHREPEARKSGDRKKRDRPRRVERPKYRPDPSLPPAVICDLDGTLALLGRRSPYDASRCEEDELNPVVAGILASLVEPGPAVILISGREDRFRTQTQRWLSNHNIAYDELHMRPSGDYRKDSIVKKEIFEREVEPRFRVEFVLDDRNQVVDMWRSLGLTCLQVADGDF